MAAASKQVFKEQNTALAGTNQLGVLYVHPKGLQNGHGHSEYSQA